MTGCLRHPEVEFVAYVDESPWNREPVEHLACPICLKTFRTFCREAFMRRKDRTLFHGLRASA